MLRELDAARGETEAALERQREFVADASHELRTPLTSILANLELLEAELEGESARRWPAPRCAPRGGCGGWWRTCCCWPAPTPAGEAPRRPVDLVGGGPRGRRGGRAARRRAPRSPSTLPDEAVPVAGVPDDLHRLVA